MRSNPINPPLFAYSHIKATCKPKVLLYHAVKTTQEALVTVKEGASQDRNPLFVAIAGTCFFLCADVVILGTLNLET